MLLYHHRYQHSQYPNQYYYQSFPTSHVYLGRALTIPHQLLAPAHFTLVTTWPSHAFSSPSGVYRIRTQLNCDSPTSSAEYPDPPSSPIRSSPAENAGGAFRRESNHVTPTGATRPIRGRYGGNVEWKEDAVACRFCCGSCEAPSGNFLFGVSGFLDARSLFW